MKIKNLVFLDEKGRNLNFKWNGEYWEGNVFFPETGKDLFSSKCVYVTEKFFNQASGETSFRYPLLTEGEELGLNPGFDSNDVKLSSYFTESDDHLFQFVSTFLESPIDRFFEDVEVASIAPIPGLEALEIDSYPLQEGSRVLLKDQVDPKENGIYIAEWNGIAYDLIRADDMESGLKLKNGVVKVQFGNENAKTLWKTFNLSPIEVGEDEILWETIDKNKTSLNSFIEDAQKLQINPITYYDFPSSSEEPTNSYGLAIGEFDEDFRKPLSLFIGFRGNSNPSSSAELVLTVKTPEKEIVIAKFNLYGESVEEDVRFQSWVENFGNKIKSLDSELFRETDLREANVDPVIMNEKRKTLFLSWDQIFPYLGSYRAFIYALRLFGYSDLRIKEYSLNNNPDSVDFGKLVRSKDIELFRDDMSLVDSFDYVNSEKHLKKTNLLGLFYNLNDPETGEFLKDSEGEVVLPFTHAEMVIKLFGLKSKLQKDFLPIGTQIKDIFGEGWYVEKWRHHTSIVNHHNILLESGITKNVTPKIETFNHIGERVKVSSTTSPPVMILPEFESVEGFKRIRYVVYKNGQLENKTSWQYDMENIQELLIQEFGEFEIFVEVETGWGIYSKWPLSVINVIEKSKNIPVINYEEVSFNVINRPLDFPDTEYILDLSFLLLNQFESVEVLEIGPDYVIFPDIDLTLTPEAIKLSFGRDSRYFSENMEVLSQSNTTFNGESAKRIDVAGIETVFSQIEENVLLHFLPDLQTYFTSSQIKITRQLITSDPLYVLGTSNVGYEVPDIIDDDEIVDSILNLENKYTIKLDSSNIIRNRSSKYKIEVEYTDSNGNFRSFEREIITIGI